jgi:hypothetical protein
MAKMSKAVASATRDVVQVRRQLTPGLISSLSGTLDAAVYLYFDKVPAGCA